MIQPKPTGKVAVSNEDEQCLAFGRVRKVVRGVTNQRPDAIALVLGDNLNSVPVERRKRGDVDGMVMQSTAGNGRRQRGSHLLTSPIAIAGGRARSYRDEDYRADDDGDQDGCRGGPQGLFTWRLPLRAASSH